MTAHRPRLALGRILEMNLGFLGLQFSFGLQQGNMAPIYSYLGADESQLPLLQLAGPMTGLLIQPLIGAMSDRTFGRWGRRTPYFVTGAVMTSVGLALMPLSSSILMAVSLLWLLDAGNNITMEPYRAYVVDRLDPPQQALGFLTQSAFTGLAQMVAFLTPSILVGLGMDRDWVDAHHIPYTVRVVFALGAVLSFSTVLWSILRVPELPLSENDKAAIRARRNGGMAVLAEIGNALLAMPQTMRRLAVMSLFQWFGMWGYWTYAVYSLARTIGHTADPHSTAFHSAVLTFGEMATFYNLVACVGAFAMVPVTRRIGAASVHAFALLCGGGGMMTLPFVTTPVGAFAPAFGIGLAWGSIMGNPPTLLGQVVPASRIGVYMGLYNVMIVVPMLLFSIVMGRLDIGSLSLGFGLYRELLGGDPRMMMRLCGACLIAAAMATLWVRGGGGRVQR